MNEPGRTMRYARALGWAAFSAGPILLTALSLIASRPGAPQTLVVNAAVAAAIAGTFALGASLLHASGRQRTARAAGAVAAIVVVATCALLAWSASQLQGPGRSSEERPPTD